MQRKRLLKLKKFLSRKECIFFALTTLVGLAMGLVMWISLPFFTPKELVKETKQTLPLVLGPQNAVVRIEGYTSLSCSHDQVFLKSALPQILKKQVQYVVHPFFYHPSDIAGFLVLSCLNPMQQKDFLFYLIEQLQQKKGEGNELTIIKKTAEQFGLNKMDVQNCLKNKENKKHLFALKEAAQTRQHIMATPTFFIKDKRIEGVKDLLSFYKEMVGDEGLEPTTPSV